MGGMTLAGLDPTNGLFIPKVNSWSKGGWGIGSTGGLCWVGSKPGGSLSSQEAAGSSSSSKSHPKNSDSRSGKSQMGAAVWSHITAGAAGAWPSSSFCVQCFPYLCPKEKAGMECSWMIPALSPEVLTVVYASAIWWWHRNVSLFLHKLWEQCQK